MSNSKPIIELVDAVVSDPNRRFSSPINFSLCGGEHLAIVGLNGSGKSTLIDTFCSSMHLKQGSQSYNFGTASKYSSDNIRHITFRDSYGSADGTYYYQQRWNASERDEAPTVAELLSKVKSDNEFREKLFSMLKINDMLDKSVILLSSGELRKFQMAKMLLDKPRVVVVESPYIGLDTAARDTLNELFESLVAEGGVQIIISVCTPNDIPDFITHVYKVEKMTCSAKMLKDEFVGLASGVEHEPSCVELPAPRALKADFEQVVQFNNLSISYGTRTVLDNINWTINKGEKWSLMGPNGSGKSTLLSLIAADNPMAYAKDITLFGRRRGTGESIWDIKKRIGYLCPEMHRSYVVDIAAVDIVASGFVDSIGLYFKPSDEQRQQCLEWMRVAGVEHLSSRSFVKLSSGEQRLLLLLRAFVKDPELLILDEPLHGLDAENKRRAKAIIETFCAREDKTMIYVTHYKTEMPSCVTHHKSLRANYSLED